LGRGARRGPCSSRGSAKNSTSLQAWARDVRRQARPASRRHHSTLASQHSEPHSSGFNDSLSQSPDRACAERVRRAGARRPLGSVRPAASTPASTGKPKGAPATSSASRSAASSSPSVSAATVSSIMSEAPRCACYGVRACSDAGSSSLSIHHAGHPAWESV